VRSVQGELALPWLNAAAEDGWPAALFVLGAFAEGAGNAREAIEMYESAAERGDAQAQDALGRMMLDLDTPEGYEKSRYWSELASEQDIVAADVRLATIHHEGLGVEQNTARAIRYWLRAAKANHSGAQLMLGVALEAGTGCEVNLVQSAFFLTLSSAENKHAKHYLNTRVLPRLSPQQSDELAVMIKRILDGAETGEA
jgi:TPR repeat protein